MPNQVLPTVLGVREENYKARLSLNSFLLVDNFSGPGRLTETEHDWTSDLVGDRAAASGFVLLLFISPLHILSVEFPVFMAL